MSLEATLQIFFEEAADLLREFEIRSDTIRFPTGPARP